MLEILELVCMGYNGLFCLVGVIVVLKAVNVKYMLY